MSTLQKPRGFTTAILHSDRDAAIEHGALHKPLHLSVAYGYRDARELAAEAGFNQFRRIDFPQNPFNLFYELRV